METSLLFFKTLQKLGLNWVRKERVEKKSDSQDELFFCDNRIASV